MLNLHNEKKKWWWIEVARYGNTPVIKCSPEWVSKFLSKEIFCLIFITSIPRGGALMALRKALGETTKEC